MKTKTPITIPGKPATDPETFDTVTLVHHEIFLAAGGKHVFRARLGLANAKGQVLPNSVRQVTISDLATNDIMQQAVNAIAASAAALYDNPPPQPGPVRGPRRIRNG